MDKGKDNDKDVEMKDSTKDNNKKDDEKAKEEEKKKKEEELNNFIEMKVAEVQDLPIDQIK